MKALTLTQPWATLVAIGAKRIETRSWKTDYRGPLVIHAAKTFPTQAKDLCYTDPFWQFVDRMGCLPTGCIVAVCDLDGYILIPSPSQRCKMFGLKIPPDEPELSFGDYTPGRWAWILRNVRQLSEPVPAKGALGLWECTVFEHEHEEVRE